MEDNHVDDDPNRGKGVKQSLETLKKKFVPGLRVSLLISLVFSFAMLIIGCLNVHKCPVEERIPLFLIALGAIGIVSKFVTYIRDRILKLFQVKYVESALYTVELVFFFLGSYWVYKEFQPSYEPTAANYCNKTAYLFAFVYLTVIYGCFIALIAGFICFVCCAFLLLQISTRTGSSRAHSYDVEGQQTEQTQIQQQKTSEAQNLTP